MGATIGLDARDSALVQNTSERTHVLTEGMRESCWQNEWKQMGKPNGGQPFACSSFHVPMGPDRVTQAAPPLFA